MLSCELFELVSQRGEAAGLDLDQQAAADKIDDETVDDAFDAIAGALVPVLELSVQRTLVERPDRRDLTFFGSDDLEDGAHDDPPSAPRRSCLRPGHRPAGAATTHNGRRTTTSPVNRTRVRAFVGQRAEPALVVVEEPKRRPLDPSPLGGADS